MDYTKYRMAIERMYEDRATIKRVIETETSWGETKTDLTTIYNDQPCRLSQKALGTNGQTTTVNQVVYETKLFISPDVVILQGDEIEVTGRGVTRTYTAGEPFPYPTHQEISIQRKEKA
ncbi:ABC transporter ATP-binding protein [Brevibacillus laterosporus]|uniref:ABC transporter ATP-binding protein n=1 Tax=Brevibacillus laterosporus TaxID=1465 RepID=UPI001443CAA0|nr:ABC transporter ATP-binding protein [Brevibacillus laterosporus]NKQ18422.1 ABC transporter ATP-binding protein [Brevibacillus laterosporus]WNX33189.1 ABC transporter ATP-binding protein [Brevibacillus laterosporus]